MMIANDQAATVFDRDTALSRVGGDVDLLREIGVLFLQEYPPAVSELRTAVTERDPKRIERKAHSLKGSVSTFGAGPAFQAALTLETQGRSGDLAQVETNLQDFEFSLARLCAEIQNLLAE
jgi:two-component system, sensor histidine kinase and response regulator